MNLSSIELQNPEVIDILLSIIFGCRTSSIPVFFPISQQREISESVIFSSNTILAKVSIPAQFFKNTSCLSKDDVRKNLVNEN